MTLRLSETNVLSIGHLLIDVLTTRLGIPLASERGGYAATTDLKLEQNTVTLTFFKPSKRHIHYAR